jgi:hypothetical protein
VEEKCLRQTYDAASSRVSGSEDDAKTVEISPLKSKLASIAMFSDGPELDGKDANARDCCASIRYLEGCAIG